MKFIHSADIHLGTPFKGLKDISNSNRSKVIMYPSRAFNNLIDIAINEQVDFVLIVGDLFDSPHPSVNTLNVAFDGFQKLNKANIPVFLSFGNHDYLNSNIPLDYFPDNVNIFTKNDVEVKTFISKQGIKVGISGFSYNSRAEYDSKIIDYPKRQSDFDFEIGTIHGSMDGLKSPEAHYAPFTYSQLKSKNYDYWALGHIHKRQFINEDNDVCYSGNTQGRNINEDGIKGINVVSINDNNVNVEFMKTDVAEWKKIEISGSKDGNLNTLQKDVFEKLKNVENKLVYININEADLMPKDMVSDVNNGILLSKLQKETNTNLVLNIKLKISPKIKIFTKLDEDYWQQASKQIFSSEEIKDVLGTLLKYEFISDYFDSETTNNLKEEIEMMFKQKNIFGE